jgi:hypothetical protein
MRLLRMAAVMLAISALAGIGTFIAMAAEAPPSVVIVLIVLALLALLTEFGLIVGYRMRARSRR